MTEDFRLISPDEAVGLLSGEPGDSGGARTILLEARFTSVDHPETDPESGRHHVAGAIQVHPSYLEAGEDEAKYYPNYDCPEDGNLLPDDRLFLALERIGITPRTRVIVYGCEPDGAMSAARLAWGLLYAGVERVALLDGGIDAWRDRGLPTVPEIETAVAVAGNSRTTAAGEPWSPRREIRCDTADVRQISRNPGNSDHRLVDVRTRGEWSGSCHEHYPFFSAAGHIPGAIFQGDWDRLVDMETHRIGARIEQVAARWRALGILDESVDRGETCLVFCCGTGWRSSISFLTARLLGLRAKNYDDGFYGWSRDGEIVVETTDEASDDRALQPETSPES